MLQKDMNVDWDLWEMASTCIECCRLYPMPIEFFQNVSKILKASGHRKQKWLDPPWCTCRDWGSLNEKYYWWKGKYSDSEEKQYRSSMRHSNLISRISKRYKNF
jgi:hypothetical protein